MIENDWDFIDFVYSIFSESIEPLVLRIIDANFAATIL